MALEPAGLDGDGAAVDGPFGAVLRDWKSAAWICVKQKKRTSVKRRAKKGWVVRK